MQPNNSVFFVHILQILKLRASNIWNDIVNNAQASSGMFLYLDPSNQEKTGVVLNAKLQLKGLIAEPHNYVPVDQLSSKQKVSWDFSHKLLFE